MSNIITKKNRSELEALCRRYHVRRLELFGSGVSGNFDPAHSDLDFLVEFGEGHEEQPFDDYFGLRDALTKLFDRPIDLVVGAALKNAFLIDEINKNRLPVYVS